MELQQKKDDIIKIVNLMIANSKPFKYDDLNLKIYEKEEGAFIAIEKQDDRIGIGLVDYNDKSKGWCTSTLAMIATITDIAVGERLAFMISEDDEETIMGAKWYEN